MTPAPFARDSVRPSRIGLGTVKLGRTQGLKYPSAHELPDDAHVNALFDAARELGVTVVDTAPAYGLAEERVGAAIEHDRDRWLLVSKVGEAFENGASSFDFSPEAVTASVERSLRRLRTAFLDAVLVHSDGDAESRLESLGTIDALRKLQDRGIVRCVGVSTKSVEGGLWAARNTDIVMVTLNPAHRADLDAIRVASGRGAGVLIKKAMMSGHVSGPDAASDAIRFACSTPGVSSVVLGTSNPENLRRAVESARGVENGPPPGE